MPDTLPLWAEITVSALLIAGAFFGLVGSWGLIRLPDPMTRLHAPTKATTLGIGGVLIASMVMIAARDGRFSVHELLITIFLVLTSPVVALFIAKVYLHLRQDRAALPRPADGADWAGYGATGPVRGQRPVETTPAQPDTTR